MARAGTSVTGSSTRIYLDNAATSFPKPEAVYAAVDDYNRRCGVAVGRGSFGQAVELQSTVDRCRALAAQLLGAESPQQIIFTFNCTDSLNVALHGLITPETHVVTTVTEHNSVLRPLRELRDRSGVEVTYVGADAAGRVSVDDIRAAIRAETVLVAVNHASNVTGTLQPIAEIGEIAQSAGALVLVDAAQSAGHVPIRLADLPVDVMCCAGHKGLLGPLGTGLLYLRPGIEERLPSQRQGGTGTRSEDDRQPDSLPDKYESGNHNAPGLVGLAAGLEFLAERGIEQLRAHEQQLTGQLLDGLLKRPQLKQYGPTDADARVGVVSVALEGFEPQVLSGILDESFGIQTRAGLHCAPRMHEALGTKPSGGTVRISPGPFSTPDDIEAVLSALSEVAGAV